MNLKILQDGNEIELESANRVYLALNYKISNKFEHDSKNYFATRF